MATKGDSKTLENKLADNLAMLVYATLDDIENGCDDSIDNSKSLSYKTICMPKKSRPAGLSAKFTIADNVRQFLAFIFNSYVEELTNASLLKDDTLEDIKAKTIEGNCECYTEFMMNLSTQIRGHMGETLISAGDVSHWFRARLVGKLPSYNMCDKLISLIYLELVDFIKSVAYLFGSLWWYTHGNITPGLFLGTMKQFGMKQIMLDMLESCIREKIPKAAKTTPNVAAVEATATEAVVVEAITETTDTPVAGTIDIPVAETSAESINTNENNLLDILNNI